jgi:hypothetical protein
MMIMVDISIKIALQQVRAQQLLQEEEVVAQQVLVQERLAEDQQQQQVQAAALQVEVYRWSKPMPPTHEFTFFTTTGWSTYLTK